MRHRLVVSVTVPTTHTHTYRYCTYANTHTHSLPLSLTYPLLISLFSFRACFSTIIIIMINNNNNYQFLCVWHLLSSFPPTSINSFFFCLPAKKPTANKCITLGSMRGSEGLLNFWLQFIACPFHTFIMRLILTTTTTAYYLLRMCLG